MGTTESILHPTHVARSQVGAGARLPPPSSARARPSVARPRPHNHNIKLLRGVVLGLTNSGKRTLLNRLEGKDPFGNSDTAKHSQEEDGPHTVTIPYQPPAHAKLWDRLQLQMQLQPCACDFCVIVINPNHDAKSLRPYISKIVTMLIQQAGYHGSSSSSSDEPPPRARPLCVCLLLNFRDLRGDRYDRIQQEDVEQWVDDILNQHEDVDRQKVIVQCTITSLKNCYGLRMLHHFIYRSYLLHKQTELERQLEEVRSQLEASRDVPIVTYEAFLTVLREAEATDLEPQTTGEPVKGDKAIQNENDQEMRQGDRQKDRKSVSGDELGESSRSSEPAIDDRQQRDHPIKDSVTPIIRSIMPKTYEDSKKALEAFLAEDDDEIDDDVTPVTSHHGRNGTRDDDEDDDFFFDEVGHRHEHGDVVESSSEQENDESLQVHGSKHLAGARGVSVMDEEDSEDEAVSVPPRSNTASRYESSTKEDVIDTVDDCVQARENVAESGWEGDDDLDLDGDEADEGNHVSHEKGKVKIDSSGQCQKDIEDMNESGNDDGDGLGGVDDDDLDLDNHVAESEPDTNSPLLVSGEEAKIGNAEKAEAANGLDDNAKVVDRPMDSSTEYADAPGATRQPESSMTDRDGVEPLSLDEKKVVDSDQAHMESTTSAMAPALTKDKTTPPDDKSRSGDDDDDNDDFVVEDASPAPEKTEPSKPLDEKSSPASSPKEQSKLGLSAAALAAIAAAEREARQMLQQAEMTSEPPNQHQTAESKPAKKIKKRKDPEAKKKKKKKKDKVNSSEEAP